MAEACAKPSWAPSLGRDFVPLQEREGTHALGGDGPGEREQPRMRGEAWEADWEDRMSEAGVVRPEHQADLRGLSPRQRRSGSSLTPGISISGQSLESAE